MTPGPTRPLGSLIDPPSARLNPGRALFPEPWAPRPGSWGSDLALCRPGVAVTSYAHREARSRARAEWRRLIALRSAEHGRAAALTAIACASGLRLAAAQAPGDRAIDWARPLRVRQPWCVTAAREWLAMARGAARRAPRLP